MLKHVDERVQTLNLTEPQKEQYAAIRLKLKSVLIGGRENRKRLMTSVREEMKKDMPDIHEVAGTISDHVGMLPAAVDKGLNLFLEFYEILDENQKAKVVQHFRDHLNRIFFKDVAETGGSSLQEDGGMTSGSLSDQMAQKRGDRHGELL
ncbi:MAG: Spy/CpxP family protein refolding chaperone [Candidatus Omnitrophica bacterium]|nr:Spy/CpxP family protein refolding chaperone [Candidatus Omnitrophota bacterium]